MFLYGFPHTSQKVGFILFQYLCGSAMQFSWQWPRSGFLPGCFSNFLIQSSLDHSWHYLVVSHPNTNKNQCCLAFSGQLWMLGGYLCIVSGGLLNHHSFEHFHPPSLQFPQARQWFQASCVLAPPPPYTLLVQFCFQPLPERELIEAGGRHQVPAKQHSLVSPGGRLCHHQSLFAALPRTAKGCQCGSLFINQHQKKSLCPGWLTLEKSDVEKQKGKGNVVKQVQAINEVGRRW